MNLSDRIINLLQEDDPKAQHKIHCMCQCINHDKIGLCVRDAAILFKSGNEWAIDQETNEKRLRTLGGCFFKICRRKFTKGEKKRLKEMTHEN